MAGLVEVTAPTVEPVELLEAKAHLRVTATDEDSLIEDLVAVARQRLERATGRAFITQTHDYILDDFPSGTFMVLPRPPLISVTSVKYTPEGAAESTFTSSDYLVDTSSKFGGRIMLKRTASWPSDTLDVLNGVVVQFVAGYGPAATDVPEPLQQAVLIDLATLFENREDSVVGTGIAFHHTVQNLISPYQLRLVV